MNTLIKNENNQFLLSLFKSLKRVSEEDMRTAFEIAGLDWEREDCPTRIVKKLVDHIALTQFLVFFQRGDIPVVSLLPNEIRELEKGIVFQKALKRELVNLLENPIVQRSVVKFLSRGDIY